MEIWSILGIEQTKDKNEIKKAYRKKLAKTNPEDNPDGFMELRSAYEEALLFADEQEPKAEDDSKSNKITLRLEEIYGSFSRRIDRKEWEELFDFDEFVSLDTSEDSFDLLMRFLMEKFCIPQSVWKLICDTFDIEDRKKELSAVYPEDFIEYVINNATFEDMIDYKLFEGDEKNFDRYIELYYKLDGAIRRRDIKNQEIFLKELQELDVYHPYYDVCRIRHELQKVLETRTEDAAGLTEEQQAALERMQGEAHDLYTSYNKDIFIINCCGDIALIREDYEKAKEYYDISYELAPDNYMVQGKQAELNYYLGDYEKSRDIYMDLLKINHYDNNVRVGMIKANQGLIDRYKEELKQDPANVKARMEMSWSLYQSYRFSEAIAQLDTITPDADLAFEYYNLKGRTYLCMDEFENALDCFFQWKEAIESIASDDTSEDAEKKRKRYEYTNFLIADCYLKRDNYKEARKYLETALKKDHEEIILSYEAMCELEYKDGSMEACLDACEELLQKDPRSYIGYDYMSRAYFRMGYINETLNACEHAISIYPYVAKPYALEIRVFLRLERVETARKILERFAELNINSDYMRYMEAQILEAEDNLDEAIHILVNTVNNADLEETDMEEFGDLYLMLGALYEQKSDVKNAIDIYDKLSKIEPRNGSVYGRLGMLYRDNDRLSDAIPMLTKQLNINPIAYYYIQRAILYRHFGRLNEAEADYKSALKDEPDNAFCYSRLGLIYELKGNFDDAIVCFDKSLRNISDEEDAETKRKPQIVACMARVYQCQNKFSESDRMYTAYIEKYGMNADVLYDYSELLFRMNRMQDAVNVLTKCIDEVPYDSDVQMCIRQLIFIYGTEGYIDKANEALQLALSKDEFDARAYGSMANIFRNRGMYGQARKLYEKAIETARIRREKGLNDDGVNYCLELAEVIIFDKGFFKPSVDAFLKKGYEVYDDANNPYVMLKLVSGKKAEKKFKEALAIAERAYRANRCSGCFYSKCHEAIFEKGIIYEAMKKYDKALECYKMALKIVGHNSIYEEKIKRIEENDSRNRSRNNK